MTTVVVEGETRFRATLAAAQARLAHPTEAMARAARLLEQRARERAPVRTGTLAGSISGVVGGDDVTVIAATRYAGYVEYGTTRVAAQPFLRPAVDGAVDQIVALHLEDANKALSGVRGV